MSAWLAATPGGAAGGLGKKGKVTPSMERKPFDAHRRLGQTLAGKYELKDIQGSGAFGTVFRAHQFFCRQFMRPVAVKVSHQTGLTEDTAPGLFGDALILARLLAGSHHDGRRHLVQIYDMGLLPEHEDRAYLAMEYVEGRPLLSHMRAAGRLSVASGLRFIKEICHALALVHGQGAIHRDLSPDNILVDQRGVVRVVDFGLATFTDRRLGFAPARWGGSPTWPRKRCKAVRRRPPMCIASDC